jgi:hypothetical protein
VKKLNQPFYLTGGTALSRHYFNHRFSDDLDLFVNNDANFNNYTETLYKAFLEKQEAGVDPVVIFEIISSFPIEKLSLIKWVENPDSEIFKKELLQIAEDILYGRENSLSL